jgi:hypothetical protein
VDQVAGNSGDAMVDFLNDRSGYCEQFATTMAAMARHLGIPARVALGFTSGDLQGDGSYLIRARDMHAWPELYFEGVGWVPFEPTPAARTGAAPAWTRPAVESSPSDPAGPTAAPTGPSGLPEGGEVEMPEDDLAGGAGIDADTGMPWPARIVLVLVGVLAIGLAPMVVGIVRRRTRWSRAAGDAVATAEAAWTDLRYAVNDARRAVEPRRPHLGLTWSDGGTNVGGSSHGHHLSVGSNPA